MSYEGVVPELKVQLNTPRVEFFQHDDIVPSSKYSTNGASTSTYSRGGGGGEGGGGEGGGGGGGGGGGEGGGGEGGRGEGGGGGGEGGGDSCSKTIAIPSIAMSPSYESPTVARNSKRNSSYP